MSHKIKNAAQRGQSSLSSSTLDARRSRVIARVRNGQLEFVVGGIRYRGVRLPGAFVWIELPEDDGEPTGD